MQIGGSFETLTFLATPETSNEIRPHVQRELWHLVFLNCTNMLVLNDPSAMDVTAGVCYQAGRRDRGLCCHTGGGWSRGEL